jgi:hypothetical protein
MEGVILFIIIVNVLRIALRGKTSQSPSAGFWIWFVKACLLGLVQGLSMVLDPPGQVAMYGAYIIVLAPSFTLKKLVVPFGMPWGAYWFAHALCPVGTMREAGAGAAVFGALALARMRPARDKVVRRAVIWLASRVNRTEAGRMRGAGVIAGGLLAALRGDRHRARCMLLLADSLPPQRVPWSTRSIARDWLVADAAENGDWREVIRLSRRNDAGFRWSRLMARISERLTSLPDGPRAWRLWIYWIVAPRRLATFALLRRALAVPRVPKPKVAVRAPPEPAADAPLPDALGSLADALNSRFAQDAPSLAASIRSVEAALDQPELRLRIEERMTALDARRDSEAILSAFRARLVDLVVPVIEECPSLAHGADRGPILDQAADRVRARLFKDIEAQCHDCNERQKREVSLEPLDEWETWAVMRESANRVLELDPASDHALFRTMYVPMCNYAVFQHNKCKRIALAHDIFSWLLQHAQGDLSALKLLKGNVQAGKP